MNFDQVQPRKKVRNPLSTLSDNIPLPQNTIQKRTSNYVKKPTKKTIVRSKSTSAAEVTVKFPQNCEKITVRSTATNTSEDTDEVFVDAEEHLLFSYVPEKKTESIELQELPSVSRIPILRKPAEKVTLKEKRGRRSSKNHNATLQIQHMFASCLYDVEYFADNYAYMLRTEGRCVFRKSYLTKFIDFKYRIVTVNWIIQIQQTLGLSEVSLFIAIRMMDYLLIKVKTTESKYALIGVTCMWIASKIYDSHVNPVKLFTLCNGQFPKSRILLMEKQILKTFNFTVNFPEPLTFLYYYLNHENLEKNCKVLFGAMFLLEMSTFLLEFSSSSPSLLAATALYLVLLHYDMNYDPFVQYIQSHLLQECAFKRFSHHMWGCIKELLVTKCFKNEAVAKYSVESKFNVVQYFTSD